LAFLLDVDFLIAIGSAGLLMLGVELSVVGNRVATSTPGVLVRAGVRVTHDRPHCLIS
jgi:hypothetical protein